jgi:hypothetical protein
MTTVIVIVLTAAGVIIAFFIQINIRIKDLKQDLKAEIDSIRKEIRDDRKEMGDDNKCLRDYIFSYMSDKAKKESCP